MGWGCVHYLADMDALALAVDRGVELAIHRELICAKRGPLEAFLTIAKRPHRRSFDSERLHSKLLATVPMAFRMSRQWMLAAVSTVTAVATWIGRRDYVGLLSERLA